MIDDPVHQTETDHHGSQACIHDQHETLADGLIVTTCYLMPDDICCFSISI